MVVKLLNHKFYIELFENLSMLENILNYYELYRNAIIRI